MCADFFYFEIFALHYFDAVLDCFLDELKNI